MSSTRFVFADYLFPVDKKFTLFSTFESPHRPLFHASCLGHVIEPKGYRIFLDIILASGTRLSKAIAMALALV